MRVFQTSSRSRIYHPWGCSSKGPQTALCVSPLPAKQKASPTLPLHSLWGLNGQGWVGL